jgi:hypothetical protein
VKRARWKSVCLVLSVSAIASHALGQDNKAAAEAVFDEAKKLMAAKRYAEACPKFADSERLDPGVGTLLNLGLCYKQNGQTASAWSAYREAASQARSEGQTDREDLARQESAALEPQLTKLVIEVPKETAAINGLEIRRDGEVVPPGLWGVPAPVDPGMRTIDVAAPNKKALHLETKTEGAGATAKVVIPPLEAGAAPPPVAVTPGDTVTPPPDQGVKTDASPGRTQRIVGFVVGGAGALTVATGTWFTLLSVAQNKASQNTSNPTKKANFKSDADNSRTIGFVGIGVGAAALIGGIVIIVTAPSGAKTALSVTPELAADRGGFRLGGAF